MSRQPLGASSLTSGELEVMLDRRLMQDDNRGVQQGVTDNVVTKSSFYLLLERKINNCKVSLAYLATAASSCPRSRWSDKVILYLP